jgi:hypothetical protein
MKACLICTALGVLLTVGCRQAAAPQAVSWESLPEVLTTRFRATKPEIRDQAMAAVASLQSNDVAMASLQLQALCGQPGLTEQQREDATRCWLTVKERLRTAASAGDASAGELIQSQRGVK